VQIFEPHKFQEQALLSKKRITALCAGIQSGKTKTGPYWMGLHVAAAQPGQNAIICAPTYKVLSQATLPNFLEVYRHYGTYHKADSKFVFHNDVTVWIRSLSDPHSIEGITNVVAVWGDEAGLFSRYAWENVSGRSAFLQAPILLTTTPYALNWLYHLWQEWTKGARDDVEFIQFRSRDNPHFPVEEYERQRRLLDPRRFAMKYEGQFGQMVGLVYPEINRVPSFVLPEGTRKYAGVDWGYTHPFALSILAKTPDEKIYQVGEYQQTGLITDDIVRVCQQRRQLYGIELFICDPAEPDKIEALNRGGCPAIAANNEIRRGVDRVTELLNAKTLWVFEDECPHTLDEFATYHYPELSELKIDDDAKEQLPVDANNHNMDATRYGCMYLTTQPSARLQKLRAATATDGGIPTHGGERLKYLKASSTRTG
jgi:PBSX family phage terminase large subunit